MIYKYGIDFGTTNSSIAMRFVGDDRAEHTLVVDVRDTLPRETIPSVILVDETGKITAVSMQAAEKNSNNGKALRSEDLIRRQSGRVIPPLVNGKTLTVIITVPAAAADTGNSAVNCLNTGRSVTAL